MKLGGKSEQDVRDFDVAVSMTIIWSKLHHFWPQNFRQDGIRSPEMMGGRDGGGGGGLSKGAGGGGHLLLSTMEYLWKIIQGWMRIVNVSILEINRLNYYWTASQQPQSFWWMAGKLLDNGEVGGASLVGPLRTEDTNISAYQASLVSDNLQ